MEWIANNPVFGAATGVVAVSAALVGLYLWRKLHGVGRTIHVARAREMFELQRERLEAMFLRVAAATGKPRGVRWVGCTFDGEPLLARDRQTRKVVALVPATLQFEAVAGGDMEGQPAVDRPKTAAAVFAFERGQWVTAGRAVFNMSPDEAVRHFQQQYERIDTGK
jgi:hypothetical protein